MNLDCGTPATCRKKLEEPSAIFSLAHGREPRMVARFLSSRLASRAGTRTAELLVHADAAGDSIGATIRKAGELLISTLRDGPHNTHSNFQRAKLALEMLPLQIWQAQRLNLSRLLLWAHNQAADALLNTLPKAYLRAATAAKLSESKEMHGPSPLLRIIRLMEHGPITFGVDPTGTLTTQDPTWTAGQEEEIWRRFLFAPPSAEEVKSILDVLLPPRFEQGTFDFLGTAENPIAPLSLANFIAQQYHGGASTKQVGVAIMPYFEGSAMRAERTARTLGAYVGSNRNLATSEAMGELIEGYQVHHISRASARKEHAFRNGTIYYRDPKPGQYGMDVMPTPPQDTQRGPHDDMSAPHGLCYNCSCYLSPVLRPLPAMQTPAFTDNQENLLPDVSAFSDWFATASTPQRRKAAGVRRLQLVANLTGREPTWADMVNPKTGKLLSLDRLKEETVDQRDARRQKVTAVISVNRALIKRVAAFGSV
jgi:hypothetical protein